MANTSKSSICMKFSIVIVCILAVLFTAVPCSAMITGEVNVGTGYERETLTEYSIVTGTLNLYPGAEVSAGIMALGGSTINFYGGHVTSSSYIIAFSAAPDPKITVYGSNFAVNGKALDPSATALVLAPPDYSTLTGLYGSGEPINLTFYGSVSVSLVTPDLPMAIDVKPGDEQNNINLKSNGVVPVAVLTTDTFDAATVDPTTARFAGAAPAHWSLEDIDGDGDKDAIFHFRTQELDLTDESTEATLTANLISQSQVRTMSAAQASTGALVSGTDKVKIIGAKKSNK